MSRRTSLALAAGVLVLFGLSYAYIEIAKPFAKKAEPVAASVPAPDPLLSVDQKSVLSVTIRSPGKAAVTFARSGDSFVLAEPKLADPRLIPEAVSAVFGSMSRIAPDELVFDPAKDGAAKLEDYGLDRPTSVRATYADSSSFELEVGGKSPSGRLYGRRSGDPRIWALPAWNYSVLALGLPDFRDRSLPAIDPKEIRELAIGGTEVGAAIRIAYFENEDDGFFMSPFRMLSPYKRQQPVDSEAFGKLTEKVPPFSVASFVDERAPLSAYGLDKPRLDILLRDPATTVHLLVGKETGADGKERFAKLAGEDRVFTVEAASLEFAKGIVPFSLLGKLPMLVGIDTVDEMVVEAGGKRRELRIERGPMPTEKDAEREEFFYANGKKVEADKFRKAYQEAIGIAIEGNLPAEFARAAMASPKPEVLITFKRNDGKSALSYRFYRASRDFLAFEWIGEREFAVSSVQVEENLKSFDALLGL